MASPTRLIAERKVAAHLREYGAVSPSRTMGYAPLRYNHARALARLRELDVVKGEGGALWLDENAWAEHRDRQRKRVLTLLALTAVSGAIAAVTALRG